MSECIPVNVVTLCGESLMISLAPDDTIDRLRAEVSKKNPGLNFHLCFGSAVLEDDVCVSAAGLTPGAIINVLLVSGSSGWYEYTSRCGSEALFVSVALKSDGTLEGAFDDSDDCHCTFFKGVGQWSAVSAVTLELCWESVSGNLKDPPMHELVAFDLKSRTLKWRECTLHSKGPPVIGEYFYSDECGPITKVVQLKVKEHGILRGFYRSIDTTGEDYGFDERIIFEGSGTWSFDSELHSLAFTWSSSSGRDCEDALWMEDSKTILWHIDGPLKLRKLHQARISNFD